MVDAEYQLKTAEATYDDLKVQLASKGLDQKAVAATVNSDFKQAGCKLIATKNWQGRLDPGFAGEALNVRAEDCPTHKLEEQRLAIATKP